MSLPRRTKILGLSLLIILLVSLGGYIYYSSKINDVTSALEEADFIVSKVDIVNSTSSSVFVEGIAEIHNTGNTENQLANIKSFHVELFNNSEKIARIELPFSSGEFNSTIPFQIEIPVNSDNPSSLTTKIITNILLGRYFSLGFQGLIVYTAFGIENSISFQNRLEFILDQDVLDLALNKFNIYKNPASINFTLYNPLSIAIDLSGEIDVGINSSIIGNINLDTSTFSPGPTTIIVPVEMKVEPPVLLTKYFNDINQAVLLFTNLTLGMGELTTKISPDLQLRAGDMQFEFVINQINSLNINLTSGVVIGDINGTITTDIPIDLNITSMSGILTSDNEEIGEFEWDQNQTIWIEQNVGSFISRLLFKTSVGEVINLGEDAILGFKNLTIEIFINGVEYSYFIKN